MSGPVTAASQRISDGRAPEAPHVHPQLALRKLLTSAGITAVLQGGSLALGFVVAVLLARLLGREEYGRYVFVLAWAGLLTIPALLGLDRFLVRGIATYEVEEKWSLMRGLLHRTNQALVLTSLCIAGIGCVVALTSFSESLRLPFCVAMLLVPLTALTLARQGTMQAIGRIVKGQLPEYAVRPLLILLGIGVLRLAGKGVLTSTSALCVNVVAVAAAFLVGAVLLRRALPAALRSVKAEYVTGTWMRASLPMMLISGVWATNSYLTTLVVGTLDGTRGAGVYSVAQRGAELIVVLLIAANMSLAPTIAKMHALGDRRGLEHTTEGVARATLLVSVPLTAAFVFFPGAYLGIFGSDFRVGATALTILAFGQLVNAISGPAGNVLLMTGHERSAMRAIGLGLLINFVLAVALVPLLGVTGGAVAFAFSLVFWNVALVILARKLVGINATALRHLAMAKATQTHPS
jgi:O-antigen/teichoic acid export membrane protein